MMACDPAPTLGVGGYVTEYLEKLLKQGMGDRRDFLGELKC